MGFQVCFHGFYGCPPQEQPVADEVCLRAYETCSTKQNPPTVISALVKQNPFFEEKQSKEHIFDQT